MDRVSSLSSGLVLSKTSDPSSNSGPSSLFVSPSDRAFYRFRRNSRSILTVARRFQLDLQSSGFRYRAALLTLTYSPDSSFSPRHISKFLHCVRQYLSFRGHVLRYVWVAELGSLSGRFHYHLVLFLPRGLTLPKPDKKGWWPHGSTRIEWARKPVAYLAAYASKGVSDHVSALAYARAFPHGARVSGFGGLSSSSRAIRAWWMLPSYIRDAFGSDLKVRRCEGGGWVSFATGEWWPPPYSVRLDLPFIVITQIRDFPSP